MSFFVKEDMGDKSSEQICIIARADMDETEIIDAIRPDDLPAYMDGAYKLLEDKLQTRINECVRSYVVMEPIHRVHKEGNSFGAELTIKFDDGEYPWIWREQYHYVIKDIWKTQIA